MRYVVSILSICFFAGCECFKGYDACVKDKETGEPIAGASIVNPQDSGESTDSTGFFHVGLSSSMFLSKCPALEVTVVKEGYKSYYIPDAANNADDDTAIIYLEKE